MTELYCLGDSLTFGSGVPKSKKWTTLAAGEDLHIVSLGVPGDTTGGMLARLQTLLQSHLAPGTKVLVMGGSNDIFYSGTDVGARSNIGAMVHQVIAAGLTPVVGIPLPIVPEDAPKEWEPVANFHEAAKLLERR